VAVGGKLFQLSHTLFETKQTLEKKTNKLANM